MEKRSVLLLLSAVTVCLTVACIVLLQDQVIMQMGFDGTPNTYFPKFVAILVPSVISIAGIILYYRANEGLTFPYVIITCSGFLVYMVLLWINCS